MLRKNSHSESEPNEPNNQSSSGELPIHEKLKQLEEFIVNNNNIPLTPYKFINEEQLFEQVDELWKTLPKSLKTAQVILKQKNSILEQAQDEYDYLIEEAQREAEQIKNQSLIVQQARQEAAQLQAQAQQECDELRQVTLQEIEKLRQQAYAECEQLRSDADNYAASVLLNLEERLAQMLKVTRNGRDSLSASTTGEASPPARKKTKRKAS